MPNISSKATEHFETAQLLLKHRRYRDSVSRAYYAMYTAVEDYVGLSSTGTWNHRGIRRAFAARMIREGVDRQKARELGQKLANALDARINADYYRPPMVQEFANQILIDAQEIFDWIEKEITP